jgi:selenocysteine lyase/cysteine desulfurase
MNDLARYRSLEFAPSVAQYIHLNHAASAASPARVVAAVQSAAALAAEDSEKYFGLVMPAMDAARAGLGRLMKVDPAHIALTRNTAHGLSIVADGLRLEPGDNVIVAECEYPAVTFPWLAQQEHDIETRVLRTGDSIAITAERLAPLVDHRTRAISLSWVQFGTGYRADLKEIEDLAHAHDALLIVDVIQGLGGLAMADGLNLDVIATGGHKWLMAPHGVGGLYIAPSVIDRFRLVNMGALSTVDPFAFDPFGFHPKPSARRYEEGTPNCLGTIGLAAALALIEEAGIERIDAHVQDLSRYATQELERIGCRVDSPHEDAHRSGIVMFRHPTATSEDCVRVLREAGVRCCVRSGDVRWSPHFYNTREDLDKAVAALPR